MDKAFLVDQLVERLRESARAAQSAGEATAVELREGATPAEKREDARAAVEHHLLGGAQHRRARRALAEIGALTDFRPSPWRPGAPIGLGALVEIEESETGAGRTFLLAPVGAGIHLTGPDGDGFLSVVTPASPIGRAVIGRRAGDVVDVTIEGEAREWTIAWVG